MSSKPDLEVLKAFLERYDAMMATMTQVIRHMQNLKELGPVVVMNKQAFDALLEKATRSYD